MKAILILAAAFCFAGCNKNKETLAAIADGNQTTEYIIPRGAHYCLNNSYLPFSDSAMHFMVRFDSSAIYSTILPQNQEDINKLMGFSDNRSGHHEFSARIGWRWSDGSLRLFGYVYNEGQVLSKEISSIPIGSFVNCSIRVSEGFYFFTAGDSEIRLPRAAKGINAEGYLLYPYFGGDETAPHEIRIQIMMIK